MFKMALAIRRICNQFPYIYNNNISFETQNIYNGVPIQTNLIEAYSRS